MERDGKMGVHLDGSITSGVSRLDVIEGRSGRRRRSKAERARIAVESLMPGVTVADVSRQHGTTRWQIHDWRKQSRKGNLVVPESMAALPAFAEVVAEVPAPPAPPVRDGFDLEIIVGDVVIRAGVGADEGRLARAIRAARAPSVARRMMPERSRISCFSGHDGGSVLHFEPWNPPLLPVKAPV